MYSQLKLGRRSLFGMAGSLFVPNFAASLAAQMTGPLVEGKSPSMIIHSRRPEDYEMPLEGFLQAITPTELFYVRSHHYTPQVDLERHSLRVGGEVASPYSITLRDLKKLPRIELVGVMECAGNGRGFYTPRLPGLQWTHGGVGNARWAGVRLADVLKTANVRASTKHILFDGADVAIGSMPKFQRSIPLKKAMDPDTMLAFEMNGKPLTPTHGFPLRLIVPGWGGDSWVKWLVGIQALDREFDGFFMKTAYRYPTKPVVPGTAIDPAQMKPVESVRAKSVIAMPRDNAVIGQGTTRIAGAAWSGEVPLAKVEVSTDGGRSWSIARLTSSNGRWAWQTWDYSWNATPGSYRIQARATDANGYSQPTEQEWNPSGYLWNVIQTVRVEVTPMLSTTYRNSCTSCHGEDIIRGQKLTRSQWEREVDKMMRWGAQVPTDQKTSLIEYLSTRFKP
ncbi:molybdopterin-dependent oxidoreductase [Bryobacter aggregatus]|uniref:molybdopterin-dependent oxidoreductase n=1 Tax=Bryobacter aggregatus TaxID=360054 RepID=UPI000691E628|nr:molybdopterin-dependent oxidoreductase [Bryobacter aggregatus]